MTRIDSGVWELANGGQEGPSLANAAAKQILTPLRRLERCPKKIEIGGSNPSATKKITQGERLGGKKGNQERPRSSQD